MFCMVYGLLCTFFTRRPLFRASESHCSVYRHSSRCSYILTSCYITNYEGRCLSKIIFSKEWHSRFFKTFWPFCSFFEKLPNFKRLRYTHYYYDDIAFLEEKKHILVVIRKRNSINPMSSGVVGNRICADRIVSALGSYAQARLSSLRSSRAAYCIAYYNAQSKRNTVFIDWLNWRGSLKACCQQKANSRIIDRYHFIEIKTKEHQLNHVSTYIIILLCFLTLFIINAHCCSTSRKFKGSSEFYNFVTSCKLGLDLDLQ